MAFAEFYCNAATGSNMNGGSDENASPSFSSTNGNWNSATGVFTVASGTVTGVAVGQFAHVFADGATTPVFVSRVTATTSTTVTVSTTVKMGTIPTTAATGISLNVGGVWKGPNGAAGFPMAGTPSFSSHAITDASGNPPRVSYKNNANYATTAGITVGTTAVCHRGYSSTPGDGGRAVFDGGSPATLFTMLTLSSGWWVADLVFQNNGTSGASTCINVSAGPGCLERVTAANCGGAGITCGSTTFVTLLGCEAYNCNTANGAGTTTAGGFVINNSSSISQAIIRCKSHGHTTANGNGFIISGTGGVAHLVGCIVYNVAGAGLLISSSNTLITLSECVFHTCAKSGVDVSTMNATGGGVVAVNCVFLSNTGYGLKMPATVNTLRYQPIINCAFYNNSTAPMQGNYGDSGTITLTGDPFNDAANGDFGLNATAGAGALLRSTARWDIPSVKNASKATTSYRDIAPSQHQDGASVQPPLIIRAPNVY